MKRILILAIVLTLGVFGAEAFAQDGNVQGCAKDSNNAAMPNVKVQLRNVDTGALVGTKDSDSGGCFAFIVSNPGNYIIEIVDASGKIIGASSSVSVAAGAAITGVTVTASAAGAAAAAAAAGGAGAFFASTGGILLLAAAGVGVGIGIYAATSDDASPSK